VLCAVISFSPDGFVFEPSEAAVLEELSNGTMEGVVALVQAAPRLLHMRMFAQHFEVSLRRLLPASPHAGFEPAFLAAWRPAAVVGAARSAPWAGCY
jgi:hypothetical protein